MENKLRIIGGLWRSRLLRFEGGADLRPTPDRVRETLFNWLQYDIAGSRCLDLYAGSGALGFEAASRGAGTVVQVENDPSAYQSLINNSRLLNAGPVSVQASDVMTFLAKPNGLFDIVFLDPPFGLGLAQPTCRLLEQHHWLVPHAKIYVETEKKLALNGMPEGWQLIRQKEAGTVAYRLYAKGET